MIRSNLCTLIAVMLTASLYPTFAEEEGHPESEIITAIRQSLQAKYAELPEVKPNTDIDKVSFQTIELAQSKTEIEGNDYYAFRFTTPEKGADLVWSFKQPEGMTRWFIVPEKDKMAGFRNFSSARLNKDTENIGPKGVRFYQQFHPDRLLKEASGYVIWFQIKEGGDTKVTLSLNMLAPDSFNAFSELFPMLD